MRRCIHQQLDGAVANYALLEKEPHRAVALLAAFQLATLPTAAGPMAPKPLLPKVATTILGAPAAAQKVRIH